MIGRIAAFAAALSVGLTPSLMAVPQSGGAAQSAEKPSSAVSKPESHQAASGEPTSDGSKVKPAATPRLDLLDVTGVSTDRAVHSLAEELAGKAARKDGGQSKAAKAAEPGYKTATGPADSAVMEFHPADPGDARTGDPLVVGSKDSKKTAAKRIHGEVYGAADPNQTGTHAAGGSVGATSKSGKASVYVETDGAHTATGAPPR